MLIVEACGGEPCDGCGGRGTRSGAGEAKSRGTVLYMGLTHVQVPTESSLNFVNRSFHVCNKNTFELNANRPPFWQYGVPVRPRPVQGPSPVDIRTDRQD